jgi:DNA-binding NarL/FixJ family response regulator
MEPRNCVLLVDDSAPIRQSLRRAFEQAGWRVCGEAGNGREAIAKAGDLHPQVVVLDLAMPEMNGITAARILKRTLPELPLILFTMYGDVFDADEANSVGISAVFSKTEPVAPLLEKARSLVDRNAA